MCITNRYYFTKIKVIVIKTISHATNKHHFSFSFLKHGENIPQRKRFVNSFFELKLHKKFLNIAKNP